MLKVICMKKETDKKKKKSSDCGSNNMQVSGTEESPQVSANSPTSVAARLALSWTGFHQKQILRYGQGANVLTDT